MDAYKELCAQVENDFDGFWAGQARANLKWTKPFTQVLDESDAPFYRWFGDGELNVSANCLDVHLTNGNADKTAIIFEADDGKVDRVTYRELLARVCRFANGLAKLGYKKGDRAIIYMPMSIEAVVAMQACARLGVTHSVVFGGFSAKSLQERIGDVGATVVITADEQVRGGKVIPPAGGRGSHRHGRLRGCQQGDRVPPHGRQGAMDRRPRPVDARRRGRPARYLRAGAGQRRASAVHPLHLVPPASPRACSIRRRATCCGPC